MTWDVTDKSFDPGFGFKWNEKLNKWEFDPIVIE